MSDNNKPKYTTDDYLKIAENMIRFGGGFVSKLGEALQRADMENTKKLEVAFSEYFEQYFNF